MSAFNQNQNRRSIRDGPGPEWDRDRGGYPPARTGYDGRGTANASPQRDSGNSSRSISRGFSPDMSLFKAGSGARRRRSRTPDRYRTHSHSRSHSLSSSDVASSRASPAPQPPVADKTLPPPVGISQGTNVGQAATVDQSKPPEAVQSEVLVLSDLKPNTAKPSQSSLILSDLKQNTNKPSESSRDGTGKASKTKVLDAMSKPERTYWLFHTPSLHLILSAISV